MRDLYALGSPPLRLLDEKHEHRQDQSRYGRDEERCPPAVERLDHRPDGKERQQQAQRQAEHENTHGPRPSVSGKQIADQRVGGGRVTGLTDADTHAHDQETPETADHAVDRGQPAPHGQPPAHQLAARTGIGHPPQWQAGYRVDEGEGGADDPQLKVAEVPFHADRLNDDGRDRAVEKIEQIGQEQQEQNAPGIRRLGRVLHGSVSFIVMGLHCQRIRARNLQSSQARECCLSLFARLIPTHGGGRSPCNNLFPIALKPIPKRLGSFSHHGLRFVHALYTSVHSPASIAQARVINDGACYGLAWSAFHYRATSERAGHT